MLCAPRLWAQTSTSNTEQVQDEGDTYEEDTTQTAETSAPGKETAYSEEDYANEYAENEEPGIVFSKPASSLPQKDRGISAAQWQKLTNDPAFQYEEQKEEIKQEEDSAWLRFFESLFKFLGSFAGKALIIGLVALLVIYIIFRVFQLKGNIFFAKKDKKISNADQDELSDHFIPESWEQVIQNAAAAGNYRLAVRHCYRYLLSMLQDKEVIRYQTAKTNYQYAYELTGTNLYQPFMQLTRGYEYVWYGGFPIGKERFEAYYEQITGIKKDLL